MPSGACTSEARTCSFAGWRRVGFGISRLLSRCSKLEQVYFDIREWKYKHLPEFIENEWFVVRSDGDGTMEKLDLDGLFECRSLQNVCIIYPKAEEEDRGQREL